MPNLDSEGAGVRLSLDTMRAVFPQAPAAITAAFVEKQDVLSAVGLNQTRQRLAYCFANLHAETGGFTIKDLVENINYTAARMAAVWPNRFSSSAAVQAKYGTAPGWQKKAFDDIYGNRMGIRCQRSDPLRTLPKHRSHALIGLSHPIVDRCGKVLVLDDRHHRTPRRKSIFNSRKHLQLMTFSAVAMGSPGYRIGPSID